MSDDRATAAEELISRSRAMRAYAGEARDRAIEMRRQAGRARTAVAGFRGAGDGALAMAGFMALPVAVALVGTDGRVVATNPSWLSLFGSALMRGQTFGSAWCALHADAFVAESMQHVLDGGAGTDVEADLPLGTGLRVLVQIAPTGPDFAGALVVVVDITDQHQLEKQLWFEATHDALTGLLNRQAMVREIEEALERRRRYGQRCGLVYLDLDLFKDVNDRYGHQAGDTLLAGVAGRWSTQVRAPDQLGRVGGDEFVVIVPYVEDVRQLVVLARRLKAALSEPFVIDGAELRVGVTAGFVEPPPGTNTEDALALADRAMYAAKSRKRGTVTAERDQVKRGGSSERGSRAGEPRGTAQ